MANLKEMSFIGANDYIGYAVLKVQPRVGNTDIYIQPPLERLQPAFLDDEVFWLENVYAQQVISSLGMYGWNDIYLHLPSSHIDQLKEDISQKPFTAFLSKPLVLIDIDHWGSYIDCGLGTRVAVAKSMGIEKLPAFVLRTEISGVVASTQEQFEELAQRKAEKLWSGSLKKVEEEGIYGRGRVKWYRAPWVFSKNVKIAREIYLRIGEEE